ncbi:hypothetical protein Pvag_pPag20096 (plasmid) [Pantoea vagans C9-1]|nr:hypothetical protein Pvag_pPag20096 [Pantoea vagans C9-1]
MISGTLLAIFFVPLFYFSVMKKRRHIQPSKRLEIR